MAVVRLVDRNERERAVDAVRRRLDVAIIGPDHPLVAIMPDFVVLG